MFGVRSDEILHLHLLKLPRTQDEVARSNLIAKRLSNLRNSERKFASQRCLHVEKVDEYALGRFWTQIRECRWIIFLRCRANQRAKHHVEKALVSQVGRTTVRTLSFDLVCAHSR